MADFSGLDALAAKRGMASVAPTPVSAPVAAPSGRFAGLDALAGRTAPPASENPFVAGGRTVAKFAAGPLGAIDAVLGAPERAVEGTVGSKGNFLERIGNGAYEAFHPNDDVTRAVNLRQAEINLGMGDRDEGEGALHGIHNFVRDTAAQTLLDPLSYLPFIGEGRLVERAAVGGTRALNYVLPPQTRGVLQRTADFFKANPEMDRALGGKGAAIYHGIYRSERGKLGLQGNADQALLYRNRAEIAKGVVPMEVRSRLLQGVYDNGSQDMRAEAVRIAHNEGVPLAEHDRPPTNTLSHAVREDYDELLRHENPQPARGGVAPAPFTKVEQRPTYAGFEQKRENLGEEAPESLMNRLDRRLATERNVVFERTVDNRLLDELVKRNAAGPLAGELIKDPQAYNALRASGVTQGTKIAGIPALQKLSDAFKTALFINPLPHMFNIARLAYLAGGTGAVARGISHFVKGGPAGELRERLEEHAGLPEYLSGAAPKYADFMPGVHALRTYGQKKLSSFDASMRAGYLEELDKALGKGPNHSLQEYEKGKEVNSALGGYDEASPVVEAIRAAGGPFAQWRLGIVPRAVGRATLRNPERVERYARGIGTLNADTGINAQFSGPEEDFGRLIASPQSAARYATSASTLGPVPAGIIGLTAGSKPDLAKAAEEVARNYIPGAGLAEEAAHLSPYSEGPNPIANTALGLVGGYTTSSLSHEQKLQQRAITNAARAMISQAMARGDYRAAWDAYVTQQQQLRTLQMQAP